MPPAILQMPLSMQYLATFFWKMPDTSLQPPTYVLHLATSSMNLPTSAYYLPTSTQNLADSTLQTASARYFLAVARNKRPTYRLKMADNTNKAAAIEWEMVDYLKNERLLLTKPVEFKYL